MPRIDRFHQTGPADVLQLEDLPLPNPGKSEIHVKVEAVGLNRAEVMFRPAGLWSPISKWAR